MLINHNFLTFFKKKLRLYATFSIFEYSESILWIFTDRLWIFRDKTVN